MNRRRFLFAASAFALLPVQSAMADYVDDVVAILEKQGFSNIEVTRTLLGRTRILATNTKGTRELVLNARTGEVLRDVWVNASGQALPGWSSADDQSGSSSSGDSSGSGTSHQSGSDDDDDDDDDDNDRDDDDNDDDDDDSDDDNDDDDGDDEDDD